MQSTILQLSPPIAMKSQDFGEVWALFLLDYGVNINPVFLCYVEGSGEMFCFNMKQLIIPHNFTFQKEL
jgi:hypothetical protein